MKITVRPLNNGEVFPCSLHIAKQIFRTTSIHLNFAYYGRDFGTFARTPDFYLVKKNIKGCVITSMYIREKQEDPILSFYVLKEMSWTKELKNEFEQTFLPEYYRLYNSLAFRETSENTTHMIITELVEGELKLHHWIMR